jgi:hypothetical protein
MLLVTNRQPVAFSRTTWILWKVVLVVIEICVPHIASDAGEVSIKVEVMLDVKDEIP